MEPVKKWTNFPRTDYVIADTCLCKGACVVFGAIVAANGAKALVYLKDGVNSNGDIKVPIAVLDGDTVVINCPHGILFEKGLFVDVTNATDLTSVSWTPVTIQSVNGVKVSEN